MSWLYSQALVVEYSAAKFSDGELSAPWSGNLTPQGYSSPDRMTAFSRLSRFGMTFAPLMADRGEELLTWFLAASLVRTSASRAKERESTVSDPGYGEKWHGSLAKYDPDSRSWKTAQHSLIEDSDESSVIWPRSGMTVDGQCYLLPTLGRRTVASASGLSPDGVTAFHTPNTTGLDGGSNSRAALKARRLWQTPVSDDSVNRAQGKFNSRGEPKLSAQVLWPTPHGFSPDGRSNGPSGNELGRAVNQSLAWPTPTIKGNYNKAGLSAKSGDGLATAVASMMATPTARDWRSGKASEATHAKNSRPLSEQIGGSLNPDWVELLMGWPKGWTDLNPSRGAVNGKTEPLVSPSESLLGWTDLKPLETGKCHSAPLPRGDCLRHEHERGTPAPLRGARLGAQDQGTADNGAGRVLAQVARGDSAASGQGGCAQAESGRAGDAA